MRIIIFVLALLPLIMNSNNSFAYKIEENANPIIKAFKLGDWEKVNNLIDQALKEKQYDLVNQASEYMNNVAKNIDEESVAAEDTSTWNVKK